MSLRDLTVCIVAVGCITMGWEVGGWLGAVLGYAIASILTFVPFESQKRWQPRI